MWSAFILCTLKGVHLQYYTLYKYIDDMSVYVLLDDEIYLYINIHLVFQNFSKHGFVTTLTWLRFPIYRTQVLILKIGTSEFLLL